MKKNVSVKGLFFLFALLTVALFSCKEESNMPGFKANREVFMGRNSISIVFPQERDTINFRDTTSGVTMTINGQELVTQDYEVKDTLSFLSESRGDTSKVKRDIKIVLKYKDFHIKNALENKRNFDFGATAVLYLSKYGELETDTIPLNYIPAVGNITGSKMYYSEQFIPETTYKEPYILVRYTGYKISY